jgi:hypothetical protein
LIHYIIYQSIFRNASYLGLFNALINESELILVIDGIPKDPQTAQVNDLSTTFPEFGNLNAIGKDALQIINVTGQEVVMQYQTRALNHALL